jgi:hypothetical protein
MPTSTYPIWYVIPLFVPLNPNLYPTHAIGTKGNYTSYVLGYVYPIPKQLVVPHVYTPYSVGNQFPIVVQLITSKERLHVQHLVIASIPTIVQINISLPIHVPKIFVHQPSDGGQLGDSLGGSSP